MNWVGGARNRIKVKNDIKKQREFFKRRRQDISSISRKGDYHDTPKPSHDLLTFNLLQIKSRKLHHKEAKPTKVIKKDLEKFRANNTSHVSLPETPIAFEKFSSRIKSKATVSSEINVMEDEENSVDDVSLSDAANAFQMSSEKDIQFRKKNNITVPFYVGNNSLMDCMGYNKKERNCEEMSETNNNGKLQSTNSYCASYPQHLTDIINKDYVDNIDKLTETYTSTNAGMKEKEKFTIFGSCKKQNESSNNYTVKHNRNVLQVDKQNDFFPYTSTNEKLEPVNNFCGYSHERNYFLTGDNKSYIDDNSEFNPKVYNNEEIKEYLNINTSSANLENAKHFTDNKSSASSTYCFNGNSKSESSDTLKIKDFMDDYDVIGHVNNGNDIFKTSQDMRCKSANPKMNTFRKPTRETSNEYCTLDFSRVNFDEGCESQDLEDYSIFQKEICLIKQSKRRLNPNIFSWLSHNADLDIENIKSNESKRKKTNFPTFNIHSQNLCLENSNTENGIPSFNNSCLKKKRTGSLKVQEYPNYIMKEEIKPGRFECIMESPESLNIKDYFGNKNLQNYSDLSNLPYSHFNQTRINRNIYDTVYKNYQECNSSNAHPEKYQQIFSNRVRNVSPFFESVYNRDMDGSCSRGTIKSKPSSLRKDLRIKSTENYPFISKTEENCIKHDGSFNVDKSIENSTKDENNSCNESGKNLFVKSTFDNLFNDSKNIHENCKDNKSCLPVTKFPKEYNETINLSLQNNKTHDDYIKYKILDTISLNSIFSGTLKNDATIVSSQNEDTFKKYPELFKTQIHLKSKESNSLHDKDAKTSNSNQVKFLPNKDGKHDRHNWEVLKIPDNFIFSNDKKVLEKSTIDNECLENYENDVDVNENLEPSDTQLPNCKMDITDASSDKHLKCEGKFKNVGKEEKKFNPVILMEFKQRNSPMQEEKKNSETYDILEVKCKKKSFSEKQKCKRHGQNKSATLECLENSETNVDIKRGSEPYNTQLPHCKMDITDAPSKIPLKCERKFKNVEKEEINFNPVTLMGHKQANSPSQEEKKNSETYDILEVKCMKKSFSEKQKCKRNEQKDSATYDICASENSNIDQNSTKKTDFENFETSISTAVLLNETTKVNTEASETYKFSGSKIPDKENLNYVEISSIHTIKNENSVILTNMTHSQEPEMTAYVESSFLNMTKVNTNETDLPNHELSDENLSNSLENRFPSDTTENENTILATMNSFKQPELTVDTKESLLETTKMSREPNETDNLTGTDVSERNILNCNEVLLHSDIRNEKALLKTIEVGTQTFFETFDFSCQVSI